MSAAFDQGQVGANHPEFSRAAIRSALLGRDPAVYVRHMSPVFELRYVMSTLTLLASSRNKHPLPGPGISLWF